MSYVEMVRNVLPLLLGTIGTVLSIYNFVDARRKTARNLQLSINTALPTYHDGHIGEPLFQVTATNTGHRNVTVTNLGLELPGNRVLALMQPYPGFVDTATPTTLSDGEIATRHFGYRDLAKAIRTSDLPSKVKIKPFAVDSAGKRHYGDALEFDAGEW
ncbi:hypothetical protein [Chachezhania sediminis]|uniref:hypothetical protein n=1 Tax=Chachezhania sediminis TaxID=2599291 RepID=UPI00131C4C31|nr:hypothetical protein [Chachezhania sediminis]